MTHALFPGTFDPITFGHINIIQRASKLFSKITIAIASSPSKQPLLTLEDRISICNEIFSQNPQIEVLGYTGLTTELILKNNFDVLIRGIRNTIDFEYEQQLTNAYKNQIPNLEVIYFPTELNQSFISSTIVRELIKHNGSIENYVPNSVIKKLRQKI